MTQTCSEASAAECRSACYIMIAFLHPSRVILFHLLIVKRQSRKSECSHHGYDVEFWLHKFMVQVVV
jgi:hypothetical protein